MPMAEQQHATTLGCGVATGNRAELEKGERPPASKGIAGSYETSAGEWQSGEGSVTVMLKVSTKKRLYSGFRDNTGY
jgi:hypothetical protein